MRKSRFGESQIVGILKEVEGGRRVKEVCREHSISDATYYQWKSKYGGMEAADLRRLKAPEEDDVHGCTNVAGAGSAGATNRRLKQRVADISLDNRALKDVIAKKL